MRDSFQKMLYYHYKKVTKEPLNFHEFMNELKAYKNREDKFLVYVGYSKKDKNQERIVYVGTTIQYPLSRWYYHKIHGKDLVFKEYCRFTNEQDMLDKEFELIQKYRPSCNKIKSRKQNYNVELSADELEKRKGNPEWCQCCLRRHVSAGYKYCYYCSTLK